jgi:hypothetical protein
MPIFSLAEAAVEPDRADSCVCTAHFRRRVFLPSRPRRVDAPAWPDHPFAGFALSASTSAARIPMGRDDMGTLATVAKAALKRPVKTDECDPLQGLWDQNRNNSVDRVTPLNWGPNDQTVFRTRCFVFHRNCSVRPPRICSSARSQSPA